MQLVNHLFSPVQLLVPYYQSYFPRVDETILNDKIIINCLQIHIQYIPCENNNILSDYKILLIKIFTRQDLLPKL